MRPPLWPPSMMAEIRQRAPDSTAGALGVDENTVQVGLCSGCSRCVNVTHRDEEILATAQIKKANLKSKSFTDASVFGRF